MNHFWTVSLFLLIHLMFSRMFSRVCSNAMVAIPTSPCFFKKLSTRSKSARVFIRLKPLVIKLGSVNETVPYLGFKLKKISFFKNFHRSFLNHRFYLPIRSAQYSSTKSKAIFLPKGFEATAVMNDVSSWRLMIVSSDALDRMLFWKKQNIFEPFSSEVKFRKHSFTYNLSNVIWRVLVRRLRMRYFSA